MCTKCAAVIVCLRVAICLSAQSTDSIVSGTISDPSGAVVSAAKVSARNLDTGVVTTSQSNDSGVYVLPPLPYGRYESTAEHTGFRKAVTENVTLEAGTKLTLNQALQFGATTETVEVQANGSTLTASTASIGSTVDGRRVEELPITGRDAMNFLFIQAGMGSNGTGYNGTRSGSLNVTTDGIATLSNRIDGINTTGIVSSSGLLGTTASKTPLVSIESRKST